MSFPLDIEKIRVLLEENTQLTSNLWSLQDEIEDEDVVHSVRRLGIISSRLGLLFSCYEIPGLNEAIETIDADNEVRFMNAAEEYQYQLSCFLKELEGDKA